MFAVFTHRDRPRDVDVMGPYDTATEACRVAAAYQQQTGIPAWVDRLVTLAEAVARTPHDADEEGRGY